MSFAYILIFGFYDFIKNSELMQIDEDVPLDLSIKTQKKSIGEEKEEAIQLRYTHGYYPSKDVFMNYQSASTEFRSKNIETQAYVEIGDMDNTQTNDAENPPTISAPFIENNTKDKRLFQSYLKFLQLRRDPSSRISGTIDLFMINEHITTLEKFRMLFNVYLFVSTILNNIISIYGLTEKLKIETINFFSLNNFDYSYSYILYHRLNVLNYLLKAKEHTENEVDFQRIDNIFHQSYVLEIFKSIDHVEIEYLPIQFQHYRGLEKKLKIFNIKTKIRFILEKIRTVGLSENILIQFYH